MTGEEYRQEMTKEDPTLAVKFCDGCDLLNEGKCTAGDNDFCPMALYAAFRFKAQFEKLMESKQ